MRVDDVSATRKALERAEVQAMDVRALVEGDLLAFRFASVLIGLSSCTMIASSFGEGGRPGRARRRGG